MGIHPRFQVRSLLATLLLAVPALAQLPSTSVATAPFADAFATEPGGSLLAIPGIASDFVLFADGALDVRADGTARLSAFAHQQSAFDREFYVTLELSGRLQPGDANYPPAGSPVVTMLPAAYVPVGPVDPALYTYYTQVTGTMVGLRVFTGARIDLTAATPIQVGLGANNKNVRLGLAGDLAMTIVQQPTIGTLNLLGPAQLRAEVVPSANWCLAHVDSNPAASGSTARLAIELPGVGNDYLFNPAGRWFENADGSATLIATVRRQSDYTDRWQLQLNLTGRIVPGDPAHPPAGMPVLNLLPSSYLAQNGTVDPAGFRYYATAIGTLTGEGLNAGGLVQLGTATPFQVGLGAGQGNLFFGVDGTTTVTVQTQPSARTLTPTGNLRLRANLSADCLLPKPVVTVGGSQTSDSVTEQRLVFHGPELGFVQQAVFGSRVLGLDARRWYEGHLRVLAHDTIEVSIPQGLAPGQYPLWFLNQTTLSSPATIDLVAPATPVLRTEEDRLVGEAQHWVIHQGASFPGIATFVLGLSTSNLPSIDPPVVSMAIGNNFAELVVAGYLQADPVTGANTFVLPAIPAYFAGFRLYAQAAVWDQFSFPVPTTDFRGTDY